MSAIQRFIKILKMTSEIEFHNKTGMSRAEAQRLSVEISTIPTITQSYFCAECCKTHVRSCPEHWTTDQKTASIFAACPKSDNYSPKRRKET